MGYEDFVFITAAKNMLMGLGTPIGGMISLKLGVRPTVWGEEVT